MDYSQIDLNEIESLIGTPSVDAKEIESRFPGVSQAIQLVNEIDPSLLVNVAYIYNTHDEAAFGVFNPSLNETINWLRVKSQLESEGFQTNIKKDVGPGDKLFAYSPGKTPEEVENRMNSVFMEKEKTGGVAIGIDSERILGFVDSMASKNPQLNPKQVSDLKVAQLASVIAHESVHARGEHGEGLPEEVQNSVFQYAVRKWQIPVQVTGEMVHASTDRLKKNAQTEGWYTFEIAEDPNTSSETLKMILEKGNNDVVSNYAVSNPNCPPEALKMVLERKLNDYVSQYAALNPNCPPEALKMVLERKLDDSVSRYAAENPNCPSEALRMILERKMDDVVSRYAASNPNCPPEALKMVLERGNDDFVSYISAENQNCPPEAKIRWMMATGKISEYDPKNPNHHEELEDKPQDNTALDEFRKLVSKSENWYKFSHIEDWYTEEVAQNPNTSPEILKRILEIGNNDSVSQSAANNKSCPSEVLKIVLERDIDDTVSQYAAYNPNCRPELLKVIIERGKNDLVSYFATQNQNCPPEVFKMILERGANDEISQTAARNPNCPPEALKMVLERGNNDYVSHYAARNPNCPPEALKMVIEKGNNDELSEQVSKNPNCPPEAKIRWMMATGKITEYDPKNPNHHEELEDKPQDNTALDEFRKLVSKSENWYKKSQIVPFTWKLIEPSLRNNYLFDAMIFPTEKEKNDSTETVLQKNSHSGDENKNGTEKDLEPNRNEADPKTMEALLDDKRVHPLIIPIPKISKFNPSLVKLSGWQSNLGGPFIGGVFGYMNGMNPAWESPFEADEIKDRQDSNDNTNMYYWNRRYNPLFSVGRVGVDRMGHPSFNYDFQIDMTWGEQRNWPSKFNERPTYWPNRPDIGVMAQTKKQEELSEEEANFVINTIKKVGYYKSLVKNGKRKAVRFIVNSEWINPVLVSAANCPHVLFFYEDKIVLWLIGKCTEEEIETIENDIKTKQNLKEVNEFVDLSSSIKNNINKIFSKCKLLCKLNGISDVYAVGGFVRTLVGTKDFSEVNDLDFTSPNPDNCLKLGSLLASDLGITDIGYDHRTGTMSFDYEGVKMDFRGKYVSYDVRPLLRQKGISCNLMNFDIYARDFTVNSLIYSFIENKIYDISGLGFKDVEEKTIRTFFDPNVVIPLNPLVITRAILLNLRGYMISDDLNVALKSCSENLFNGRVSKERLAYECEKILGYEEDGEYMLKEYNLEKLKEVREEVKNKNQNWFKK